MKIKVRVDLSKAWKAFLFAAYLTVLGGVILQPILGQLDESSGWRRTSRGWEHAVALQKTSSVAVMPENLPPALSWSNSTNAKLHRIALPVAIGSFFVFFGCWLLTSIPNRAIHRRLASPN